MRILVFTFQFPPRMGGVETMSWHLSNQFARAGVETTVLTVQGKQNTQDQEIFAVYRLPVGDTNSLYRQVQQKIRWLGILDNCLSTAKPDCIVCVHWDPCAYLTRLNSLGNRPYFVIAHGMELFQLPSNPIARRAKQWLRDWSLKGARQIFSVSHYTQERTLSIGISPHKIQVIPNGVECRNQSPLENMTKRDDNRWTLLTLSRLVPRKGHATVLRALPLVLAKLPNLVYKIAGEGPERKCLEQLVHSLGIEEHVVFCGAVNEESKDRLLRNCDLFVLPCYETPTDFEGFGIALLEAMCYSRPIIAGLSGGIPDVVQHGQNGLLVNPNDPQALAHMIIDLLQHPEEARRLGVNGLYSVRERFQWQTISRQYLDSIRASL